MEAQTTCKAIVEQILNQYAGKKLTHKSMLYCMADIAVQCYQRGVKDGREERNALWKKSD